MEPCVGASIVLPQKSNLPMLAQETIAVSLLVGQAEEGLVIVETMLKERKFPSTKTACVCMAADSIIKMSCWIGRWKGQPCFYPSMQRSPPRALVSITLLKNEIWSFLPLGGKVLAVCISQLGWEPVFGTKHAWVGRHCLGCNQQIERAMWISSVSGLFPSILLLGAHSEKPSLSVLGFGEVLPAVVFQKRISKFEDIWVSMDTSIEPGCWGKFYITWMDTSILVKIKSLFQCPYYKESLNIFKVGFFSLKNHCVRRSTKVIPIF